MRTRLRAVPLLVAFVAAGLPLAFSTSVVATPNPVATDEASYQAFGRVFPDPHGCLAFGVPDQDGDGIKDTPRGVSPWAKGRVCADQFLQYEEVIEGAKFLARRFPEFLQVIRLDQAYDNPNYMSAGLPRMVVNEDGKVKTLGRDRRPLYMFKITDSTSDVPERERQHFAYTLSIHGIERAGVEGGVRAMEDLVTWAACEQEKYASPELPALPPPACGAEGPFPRSIVETPTEDPVPTAGETLDNAVVYLILPNPDGWARGQVSPVEVEDGSPNTNYTPGFFFQRYNGNGVDVNRDWPTIGYTFRPYSPGSEPETKAFGEVLRGIKKATADGRFSGGIDLHGMITAHAFSYTLLGAGQRDFRKNEVTVETAIRTFLDQSQRMAWSPYIADANANGELDGDEVCTGEGLNVPNVYGGGTRGRIPACVADQWGTVIDTIGYQISGGLGDWLDSPLGLDAVGIDNEMYASHLAPNTVFDPALEQTHIDGNKGLIYSQISALLTEEPSTFEPAGKVGYVFNPTRLQIDKAERPQNPGYPAQNDIEALLPCQSAAAQNVDAAAPCGEGTFVHTGGAGTAFEFEVKGVADGIWNGGLTATLTGPNATGVGTNSVNAMQLQQEDEGQWHTIAYHYRQGCILVGCGTNPTSPAPDLYGPAGQVLTINDPQPGRYRIFFSNSASLPGRLKIDFHPGSAEDSPGQTPIDASSMDFFEELNEYVPAGSELEAVPVQDVMSNPQRLAAFDTLIVVNRMGDPAFLAEGLGLAPGQVNVYFDKLRKFAEDGGNLVLTDAALLAAAEIGLVPSAEVQALTAGEETFAGNYAFQIQNGLTTYQDPERFPLAAGVQKPGTAEQENGRRQAVEPAPLGYSPDYGLDATPKLPFWGIGKAAWQAACGLEDCVTATTTTNGSAVNLGEAALGDGRVRIAGILLPDPVFEPDVANDHRFGVADYALTYTAWEVFKNLLA